MFSASTNPIFDLNRNRPSFMEDDKSPKSNLPKKRGSCMVPSTTAKMFNIRQDRAKKKSMMSTHSPYTSHKIRDLEGDKNKLLGAAKKKKKVIANPTKGMSSIQAGNYRRQSLDKSAILKGLSNLN